jgi:hypothetical protein
MKRRRRRTRKYKRRRKRITRKKRKRRRRRRRYRGGSNCSLKGGLCNMFKSSGQSIKHLGGKITHGSKKIFNGITPGCPPDCRYTT